MPDEKEIRQIVEEVVRDVAHDQRREDIREILASLGIDSDDIHEIQADMLFLRRQRTASEEASKYIRRGIWGLLFLSIPVIISLVWAGIKQQLGIGGSG